MEKIIDCKGMACPLPVVNAKKAAEALNAGDVLTVLVDNEIAVQNLTRFAEHKGFRVSGEKKAEKEYADTISNAKVKLDESVIKQEEHDKIVLDGQKKLGEAYLKAYNATGDEKYLNAFGDTADKINEMQGVVDSNIEAQKKAEQSARELEHAQKRLADAQNELADAQQTGDLKQIYAAEKKVEQAQVQVDARNGNGTTSGVTVPVNITAGNLDAFTAHIKEEIGKTDLADPMMKTLEELAEKAKFSQHKLTPEELKEFDFVKVSRSCLVNVNELVRIKALANSRLEAELSNGEKLIVSRTYIPEIKRKLFQEV